MRDTSEPRWIEPVRFGLALTWVACLTLWTYQQGSVYQFSTLPYETSLIAASLTLRTVEPFWFACFFPSMAVGIAWYAFVRRGPTTPSTLLSCGMDRLTVAQSYANLCVAISVFAMNYRIMPILPLCTSGCERASLHVAELEHMDIASWGPMQPVIEQQAWIGLLATGLVILQAWMLLPRLGGQRRNLIALVTLLLLAGLGTNWGGLLPEIPSAIQRQFFALDMDDPTLRGLLLDDPRHEDTARLTLSTYFETHTDAGEVIRQRQALEGWLPEWEKLARHERLAKLCQLCLLPGSLIWSTHGLPMKLRDEPPTDQQPSRIIEMPRGAGLFRVHEPGTRPPAGIPLSAVPLAVGDSDWVVLKIDVAVPMPQVVPLLMDLEQLGVRRVDLAVIPYGFHMLESELPLLSFEKVPGAAPYRPKPRPKGKKNTITVKKYIPPPGWSPPERQCEEVDEWKREEAWSRSLLDEPGSLPESVALASADLSYGEFIGQLQGAMSGGARTLVLEPRVTQP